MATSASTNSSNEPKGIRSFKGGQIYGPSIPVVDSLCSIHSEEILSNSLSVHALHMTLISIIYISTFLFLNEVTFEVLMSRECFMVKILLTFCRPASSERVVKNQVRGK